MQFSLLDICLLSPQCRKAWVGATSPVSCCKGVAISPSSSMHSSGTTSTTTPVCTSPPETAWQGKGLDVLSRVLLNQQVNCFPANPAFFLSSRSSYCRYHVDMISGYKWVGRRTYHSEVWMYGRLKPWIWGSLLFVVVWVFLQVVLSCLSDWAMMKPNILQRHKMENRQLIRKVAAVLHHHKTKSSYTKN